MPVSQSKSADSRRSGPAALDVEFERLQSAGRDEAAALHLALPAQDERGQATCPAHGGDLILVVRVFEAVDRFADQEAARAVVDVVGQVDAGRQHRRDDHGAGYDLGFIGGFGDVLRGCGVRGVRRRRLGSLGDFGRRFDRRRRGNGDRRRALGPGLGCRRLRDRQRRRRHFRQRRGQRRGFRCFAQFRGPEADADVQRQRQHQRERQHAARPQADAGHGERRGGRSGRAAEVGGGHEARISGLVRRRHAARIARPAERGARRIPRLAKLH